MSKIAQYLREWTDELDRNDEDAQMLSRLLRCGKIMQSNLDGMSHFVLHVDVSITRGDGDPRSLLKKWLECPK